MNKLIEEYDQNGKLIQTFNSMKEAEEILKISNWKLKDIIENNKTFNDKKYKIKHIENDWKRLVKCDNCGKEFMCERWRIEQRKHVFCCRKCSGEFTKKQTKPNVKCEVCGKEYHLKPSHVHKNKRHFCSKECLLEGRRKWMIGEGNHQFGLKGDLNASWKTNEKISYYGYKLIRVLDHPFKNSDGFVFEHRLIAEKYLLTENNFIEINGIKYLHPDYVVHHLDFNRLNNDPKNLLIINKSEHMKLHVKLRHEESMLKYCEEYGLDYKIVTSNRNEILKEINDKKVG